MLHEILSAPIPAFVSDFKWILPAFERGWATKPIEISHFDYCGHEQWMMRQHRPFDLMLILTGLLF